MRKQDAFLLMAALAAVLLCGCVTQESGEKTEDLEFTVARDADLPEALREQIEEKKEGEFTLTYSDNEYLYAVRGYGLQETGGYSISVEECYLSDTAICLTTRLRGPAEGEEVDKTPTCPYIVIKLELREEEVLFR